MRLGTPYQDGVAAQPPAGVVVGGQGQAVGIDFLLDDYGVVDVQSAAAVLHGGGGPEPAALAQLAPQIAAELVLLPSQIGGVGGVRDALRHVVFQPGVDLAAEGFLFGGVTRFKVHWAPPG